MLVKMPKPEPSNLDSEALNGSVNRQGSEREAWVLSTLARFERRLCVYAFRILGDAERARDIVQETFLELCRQERVELEGHLAEWLFTVCRNRALDVRAKENHMQTREQIGDELKLSAAAAGRTAESFDPAHIVEQEEEQGRATDLLASLPDNQREVLYLKFQQGLSYKEISKVTGHSIGNVGFLIHTGMKTLRGRMKEAV